MTWRDVVEIKRQHSSGFCNGGWAYDAYPELETLDAGKAITVAEIKGPAVITCMHMTQHFSGGDSGLPEGERAARRVLFARGIILEVYYNDVPTPAVRVPVGDFFGDGCGGRADHFSSVYVEKAPESYNCFIPMPFEKSVRVVLRNETPFNLANYTFVEYEKLPSWEENLGYLHATWKRFAFQLNGKTDQPFFHINGCGHLLGRAWSIGTNESFFNRFNFIMEGNNEIRLDGELEPRVNYLGTEDSFGFSWGFQKHYSGPYSGITFVQAETPSMLSIYRFFGPNVIRFNKSLDLRVNWIHEMSHLDAGFWSGITWPHEAAPISDYQTFQAYLEQLNRQNGCWVDYATTYYWYQDAVGYEHEPMPALEERIKPVLR